MGEIKIRDLGLKMRDRTRIILFLLVVGVLNILLLKSVYAQESSNENWRIKFGSGVPFTSFNEANRMNPVYDISLIYDVNPLFALQTSLHKGIFENTNRPSWFGRTFKNQFYSFTIRPEINITAMIGVDKLMNIFQIKGFSGIGILHNDVKTGMNPDLMVEPYVYKEESTQKFLGHNNTTNTLFYSLGIGLDISLTSRLALFVQYEYNLTNSDFVDGYATINDPLHGPNNYNNDNYSLLTSGISIRLGGGGKTVFRSGRRLPASSSLKKNTADSLLYKKLTTMIEENGKILEETSDRLNKTNLIIKNFVNQTATNQMNFENKKIKRIQAQIDSMRSMRAQLDYLNNKIDSKIKTDSNDKLPKYFIIADAFLEINKAQSLLKQLKDIGYNDAKVINDISKAWYLVAYAEVGNEQQADEILKKIRAYQNPSAWIYTNK